MAPTTITTTKGDSAHTYNTTGTVSSPLNLDSFLTPRGEHETVNLTGSSHAKKIRPKPKVTLTALTVNNSGTLRKINSIVIPIVYSEKFYKDVLDPKLEGINKLMYYGDIPVGTVCCRFENLSSTSKDKPPTLVILTLAILAPYRSMTLGTALLLSALRSALHPTAPPPSTPSDIKTNTRASLTVAPPHKPVKRAMVHVQVGNDGAKMFYGRLGFKEIETVKDYYSKLEPRDAVLMVCEDTSTVVGQDQTNAPNGAA